MGCCCFFSTEFGATVSRLSCFSLSQSKHRWRTRWRSTVYSSCSDQIFEPREGLTKSLMRLFSVERFYLRCSIHESIARWPLPTCSHCYDNYLTGLRFQHKSFTSSSPPSINKKVAEEQNKLLLFPRIISGPALVNSKQRELTLSDLLPSTTAIGFIAHCDNH